MRIWNQIIQLPNNSPDACRSVLDPTFDGSVYRVNLQVGEKVGEPAFGYIIECVPCTHPLEHNYGEDGGIIKVAKGEYLCGIWRSTARTLYAVTGTKDTIYADLEKRFIEVTKNPAARLKGIPWNIISRSDLLLFKSVGFELDRMDAQQNERKFKLMSAMNRPMKPKEQHWATLKRPKEREDRHGEGI